MKLSYLMGLKTVKHEGENKGKIPLTPFLPLLPNIIWFIGQYYDVIKKNCKQNDFGFTIKIKI